jgi:hypothetical protein
MAGTINVFLLVFRDWVPERLWCRERNFGKS